MIPIELYGIQPDMVERFYDELPGLVEDVYEDKHYIDALYEIESERSLNHLHIADRWAENTPLVWNDDIENEVLMALRTIAYPKVHLLEHILSLDNIDTVRLSQWMHFSTNVYPVYSEKACETLTRMGVPTPFDKNDIASYGLYVQRLEGLKLYAPAHGLPEIGLPRARILQLGLERFE
tara:strand:+ start:237 stop:773 length:537 start_codon:yes stop_codon:yes gene_type:complete